MISPHTFISIYFTCASFLSKNVEHIAIFLTLYAEKFICGNSLYRSEFSLLKQVLLLKVFSM